MPLKINANEEEIEYFNFIPASFTLELQHSLETVLHDSFNDTNKYLSPFLQESFRKNFFLFNNFVLRNIFKFPSNFCLERKTTDKVIKDDLNKKIAELRKVKDILIKKKQTLHEKKLEFVQSVNINEGFRCLLENNMKHGAMENLDEVEKLLFATKEKYEQHSLRGSGIKEEFRKLMEHRYMKNEFYQEEKKKLREIAEIDEIENMVNNISKF